MLFRRIALALIVVIAVLAAAAMMPLIPGRQSESPDGGFVAITHVAAVDLFRFVMPGHGGDKPGQVTVYRSDGRSCGSAGLPMVSMVSDIRWTLDCAPREARLVGVASWDLDACKVTTQ